MPRKKKSKKKKDSDDESGEDVFSGSDESESEEEPTAEDLNFIDDKTSHEPLATTKKGSKKVVKEHWELLWNIMDAVTMGRKVRNLSEKDTLYYLSELRKWQDKVQKSSNNKLKTQYQKLVSDLEEHRDSFLPPETNVPDPVLAPKPKKKKKQVVFSDDEEPPPPKSAMARVRELHPPKALSAPIVTLQPRNIVHRRVVEEYKEPEVMKPAKVHKEKPPSIPAAAVAATSKPSCSKARKLGKKSHVGPKGGVYYNTKGGRKVYCAETSKRILSIAEFIKLYTIKELREHAKLLQISSKGLKKSKLGRAVWAKYKEHAK